MKKLSIELPEADVPVQAPQSYPNSYTTIPTNGKICPYTGLKHAQLYKWLTGDGAARPFVRVAQLKLPGASKGKTLFQVSDMLNYIDHLAEKQGSGASRLTAKGE